jgi:hypothetical protein
MWTCTKCGRIFEKAKQPHSCRKIPLEQHFKNKDKAKELFDHLVKHINGKIGKCQIISLPCCVHLFGNYDFLAALPKKDKLEIRFALDREIDSLRLTQSVPMSAKVFKNCIDIKAIEEINEELILWLNQAYRLKDKQ